MKVGKILKCIVLVFLAIACFRVIIGNNRELSIYGALKSAEEHGEIYDFDDFWFDVQKVKWNFTSLTNALKAEGGQTYQAYYWRDIGDQPAVPGYGIRIDDTEENVVGYFLIVNEEKPTANNVTEWLTYIGRFIGYIGRTLVAVGGVLFDVLMSVINVLYKALFFLYYLLFT